MKGNGVTIETLAPPAQSESEGEFPPGKLVNQEQISRVIERMLHSAQHKTVFGEPVVVGEYTLITACEVASGGGFGFGMGPELREQEPVGAAKAAEEATPIRHFATTVLGNGGGGGGGSIGRPIAVIIAGPDGVKVKPIVDVTKFMITFFTAWKVVASTAMLAWRKVGARANRARK
jgi:uncharacterized spore protein YtfJ